MGMELKGAPGNITGKEFLEVNDHFLNNIYDSSFAAFFKSNNAAQEETDLSYMLQIAQELQKEGEIAKLASSCPNTTVTLVPYLMTMEEFICEINDAKPLRLNNYDKYTADYYHQYIGSKLDADQWEEVIKNTHMNSSFCLLCAHETAKKIIKPQPGNKRMRPDKIINLMLKCIARHELFVVLKSCAYNSTCKICDDDTTFNNTNAAYKHILRGHVLNIISHKVPDGICPIERYKLSKVDNSLAAQDE